MSKYRVYNYEGWSLNNTKNHIYFEKGEGVIVFLSKDKISEVELIGLEELVRRKADIYKGLDIEIFLYKGKYHSSSDLIQSNEPSIIYPTIRIEKASKICEENYCKDSLNDLRDIVLIKYKSSLREQGFWSNLFNIRKMTIINNFI